MPSGNGAPKQILVVDDEPVILELIEHALSTGDYSVSNARDGVEALALFSESPYHLVITDFEMPRMKGDELVEKLRRLVPGQRIIMVSSNWQKLADPLSKVNLCLAKPFLVGDLIMAVRRVLQDGERSLRLA